MSKVILLPALCVWTVVSTAAAVPIGGIFGMGMWSYMLTEELPNYYKNSDSNFILNANLKFAMP